MASVTCRIIVVTEMMIEVPFASTRERATHACASLVQRIGVLEVIFLEQHIVCNHVLPAVNESRLALAMAAAATAITSSCIETCAY